MTKTCSSYHTHRHYISKQAGTVTAEGTLGHTHTHTHTHTHSLLSRKTAREGNIVPLTVSRKLLSSNAFTWSYGHVCCLIGIRLHLGQGKQRQVIRTFLRTDVNNSLIGSLNTANAPVVMYSCKTLGCCKVSKRN